MAVFMATVLRQLCEVFDMSIQISIGTKRTSKIIEVQSHSQVFIERLKNHPAKVLAIWSGERFKGV